MKPAALLLFMILFQNIRAQTDKWTICLDSKPLAYGYDSAGKSEIPDIYLPEPAAGKKKYLSVRYQSGISAVAWSYTCQLRTEQDQILPVSDSSKAGASCRFNLQRLTELTRAHDVLLLNVEQNPLDPGLSIRSKRVLIARIRSAKKS
jgi:hypothetical protein